MGHKEKIKQLPAEQLVEMFEMTDGMTDDVTPTVRGWLLDEFEARNPEAFERWMLSCDDSPRAFFI